MDKLEILAWVCQVSCFQLNTIRTVQNVLSPESPERLSHAFVTARLDYCNSILVGIPDAAIQKLQQLQNSAARFVSKTGRYEHIIPVLKALHWFPVRYRIDFKITVLLINHGINYLHRISATCYRYSTQQGHWGPQDYASCWHRGLESTRLVVGHSIMQHPHYGINSQTLSFIKYCIFLNSVMSMYILTVHLVILSSLLNFYVKHPRTTQLNVLLYKVTP